jgi:hypothetical protein
MFLIICSCIQPMFVTITQIFLPSRHDISSSHLTMDSNLLQFNSEMNIDYFATHVMEKLYNEITDFWNMFLLISFNHTIGPLFLSLFSL